MVMMMLLKCAFFILLKTEIESRQNAQSNDD